MCTFINFISQEINLILKLMFAIIKTTYFINET